MNTKVEVKTDEVRCEFLSPLGRTTQYLTFQDGLPNVGDQILLPSMSDREEDSYTCDEGLVLRRRWVSYALNKFRVELLIG